MLRIIKTTRKKNNKCDVKPRPDSSWPPLFLKCCTEIPLLLGDKCKYSYLLVAGHQYKVIFIVWFLLSDVWKLLLKVTLLGFSLTIPTLFIRTQNTKILPETKQEIKYCIAYLNSGMAWSFQKFEIGVSMATQWCHCHNYFSIIFDKTRHSFLKLIRLIAYKSLYFIPAVLSCTNICHFNESVLDKSLFEIFGC